MSDESEYHFHDPESLLGIANRQELQADEKPIFAVSKDDDAEYTLGVANPEKSGQAGRMKAERLDGFKAVYNPASGRVFGAVTDDYEVINPPEFFGPLCGLLKERDRTDVSGNVWVRNGGANGYAQVLFADTHSIYLPGRGRSDPVRVGFSVRWSHDGGISVRADGFAQDTRCTNSIRKVTSPIHVKHAGDVDERVDWETEWNTVLDQLGAFSEALSGIIEEAMGHTVFDFAEFDGENTWIEATDPLDTLAKVNPPGPVTDRQRDSVYAFYELLGLPKYLGVAATRRLMWRLGAKDDPRDATAWDVHSAATYALTHEGRGTPGASDDRHHSIASDLLLNPQKALEDAGAAAVAATTPDDNQRVLGVSEDTIEGDTGEALRSYSERSRALEQSFGD